MPVLISKIKMLKNKLYLITKYLSCNFLITCVTIEDTSEVLLGIITVLVDLASFPKASTYDSAILRDAALYPS